MHKYTNEELEFLRVHVKTHTYKEVTEMFNNHFGTSLSEVAIKSTAKRNNIYTGRNGQYNKGNVPVNKGTKGIMKPNSGTFKKGHIPKNHRPVGSERINRYGYIEIKVEEPRKWRPKHHLIYEAEFGPIPPNHKIVFKDRNKKNVNINNLLLVSNREMVVMNRNKLIKNNPEATETGQLIAKLMIKTSERKHK